jgi:dipeptidyl aminopeptidase/acylaminoacyl peptidase
MKTWLLPATLAALATVSSAADWSPDLALRVKRVQAVQASPDGTRVAYVVGTAAIEGEKSEWLSHVHVAKADGTGAFALTSGERSSTNPAWSPDGKWIAFLSGRGPKDKDGKEPKANVWRIRVDGGEAEELTSEEGGVSALEWSPDGKTIAFLVTDPKSDEEENADKEKRDARVVDEALKLTRLYVVPVEKNAEGKRPVRRLTEGTLSLGNLAGPSDFAWSPDGRSIVFSHQPTPHINDWPLADISIVDVATGKVRALASTGASETDPIFSPDGKQVAYDQSNDPPTWRRRSRIAIVPVEGGTPRLLAETPDAQPDLVGWTKDGRIVFGETHRTMNRIGVVPVAGGAPAWVSPDGVMVDGPSLNASGTHVGFSSQAPNRAPEPYTAPLAKFVPVQAAKVQELPELSFGKTETLTWKSPDGKEVEGLVTYPVGYAAGKKVPLLVVVHGGPAGVFVQSFTGGPTPYPVAGFASHGYAVLRVNPRGSSGYGFDYRSANYRDWGKGDYQDIQSGVDALIAKGVVDPERMGVMGWSYGGYMTSWTITQTSRFKAASVGAGVTNLMSFQGTADIPGFLPDYFGGEFWDAEGSARFQGHSAMFHVGDVKTPTLIQHGEQDLRVPTSQGYELYGALKRRKVPVKMVTYPRTPHGIQEPKLMLDAMNRNLAWFDEWVLGKKGASAAAGGSNP